MKNYRFKVVFEGELGAYSKEHAKDILRYDLSIEGLNRRGLHLSQNISLGDEIIEIKCHDILEGHRKSLRRTIREFEDRCNREWTKNIEEFKSKGSLIKRKDYIRFLNELQKEMVPPDFTDDCLRGPYAEFSVDRLVDDLKKELSWHGFVVDPDDIISQEDNNGKK